MLLIWDYFYSQATYCGPQLGPPRIVSGKGKPQTLLHEIIRVHVFNSTITSPTIMLRHSCWESSLVKSFVRLWRTGAGKHLHSRSTGDQAASLQPATQTRLIFLFVRSNRKLWAGDVPCFSRAFSGQENGRSEWRAILRGRGKRRLAKQVCVCACVCGPCVWQS